MTSTSPPATRKHLLLWTRSVLRKHSIKPFRKLSQNFVVDPKLIRDVLEAIDKDKAFIEIGSGIGTLSYYLTRSVRGNNVCFEIDHRLAEIAVEHVYPPSILLVGNALEHDWVYRQVVSNTPYHVTSDILVKTARSNHVEKAVLVLQKDVVDRLLAKPGEKEYGRLTILITLLFEVYPGPVYPPSSFYPKPDVSSRLVTLIRRRRYDSLINRVEDITRRIFSKRRKRAVKVLVEELGLSEYKLSSIGIGLHQRVYELSPGVILRLAEEVRDIG